LGGVRAQSDPTLMPKNSFNALAAVCAVATVTLAAGCGKPSLNNPSSPSPAPSAPATHTSAPQTALGQFLSAGKPLFPHDRVVAYYGAAGVPAMGVLGSAPPAGIAPRLLRQARAYDRFGRPVIPALELIAVIAQGAPGDGGTYHGVTDTATVRQYLNEARRISALLIIDIQPGRATFLPLVKHYEPLLREPDVGLALDPEWEMTSSQVPGNTIGGTTAAEVNGVGDYLAALVKQHHLPQKLFAIHQFTLDMIDHRSAVRYHPELATTFHVDGFGGRSIKLIKYHAISTHDSHFHNGFKLFYTQDTDMLSVADAMKLRPQPDLLTYE